MQHPFSRGTRVEKTNSEPGDAHRNGEMGTVRSVLGPTPRDIPTPRGVIPKGTYGYFVEWDNLRGIPIATVGLKVKAVPA